ncbi:MAG: pitrilysin family protein [Candidatus Zixiibacteriota bacterium]
MISPKRPAHMVMILTSAALVAFGSTAALSFSIPHQTHTLPNGIRVILAPDRTVPTVSYYTMIDAGSRDETKKGTTGLAHVFEHMMFRGTDRYPAFDNVVGPMGAQTNASTSNDMTSYFVNAKGEFLREIIDLESDRLRNLIFTNEAFRTELGPVKEERRRGVVEDPYGYLDVRLGDLAFDKHTYKHPVIGWEEDLEKLMTFEDGLRFKETFYSPKYTVISVAGNFDPDSALAWIREKYADWQPAPVPVDPIPVEPGQTAPRREDLTWKDAMIAPILMLAHKSPATGYDTEDFVAFKVIDRILFAQSGRLRQRLVVTDQLVEDVGAGVWGSKDPSLWTISATVKSGIPIDSVEGVIDEELRRLREEPVGADEVAKAVRGIKADMIYGLDRPARVASTLGRYAIISGSSANLEREMAMLDQVTPATVQRVAQTWLVDARRTTVTLSPKSES